MRNFIRVGKSFLDKTRMTTFIRAKLKKSDDQMNIDKYRVAVDIMDYHIIYQN